MKSLILIALLVAMVASCSCESRQVSDYLKFSYPSLKGNQEFAWLRKAIEADGSTNADDTADYINKINEECKQLTRDSKSELPVELSSFNGRITELYSLVDSLLTIADTDSGARCLDPSIKTMVTVVDEVFGGLDSFSKLIRANKEPAQDVKLFRYLKQYGVEMFEECLDRTEDEYDHRMAARVDQKYLDQMDELISLGKSKKMTGAQLASEAREVDFLTGNPSNSKAMTKIAGKFLKSMSSKNAPLVEYLTMACAHLRSAIGPLIDSYNLGRLLSPVKAAEVQPPVRFDRLNEYNRICLSIQDPESRKLINAKLLK